VLLTLLQSTGTPPEPPTPDPGGGPGNKFRLLTDRLPDFIEDDDEAIAIALTLLVAA
jgi:hypothetical protein